jgi:extracellular elastinolytic metalloproteinase
MEALEVRRLLASAANLVLIGPDNELHFDNPIPQTRFLNTPQGFLTKASKSSALSVARQLLASRSADLGMTTADAQLAAVSDQYTDTDTGVTHVYFRQTFNGLPVIDADASVHVMSDGRVVAASGGFVSGLADLERGAPAQSTLSANDALTIAARQLGLTRLSTSARVNRSSTFTDLGLSIDPIVTKLVYAPTEAGVELAWNFNLNVPGGDHWFDVAVGQESAQIIFASDWVDDATYNVFPRPIESPVDGSRSLVTDPQDVIASPFGWHDTNGVAGAEFTDTRGNNVSAQDDINADNFGGTRPSGGASLNFDFPLDLAQPPSVNLSAATTNLFYWNNLLHDIHYRYGFTEAAGNFQTNNYGKGGSGNDAVQADAQDGSGFNNANFATPADGASGRMQMYIFTAANPDRDGDLQADIIIHEYGHGVSNRLTGGPANANALDAIQSGGMGEGWGDWWALMLTQKPSDTKLGVYPAGNWVLNQSPSGPGVRRFPYSFNMAVNPVTVDYYGTGTTSGGVTRSTEVHNTGEIWCAALWDMAWLLMDKYGFEPNVQNGYDPANVRGNTLALKLVMDALKLQPANPSFKQARDAIFAADVALTGGANALEIWTAFARRGMGENFNTASSGSTAVTPDFTVPVLDPFVTSVTPSGSVISPVTNVTFNFNQAMNTGSFDPAVDVLAFTGPGGADLRSNITSFQWLTNSQLRINFPALALGSYSVTIGPNILAADNDQPMNQNANGLSGEAVDTFTTNFTYGTSLGPEGFGYRAAQYPMDNVDLTIGGPDVTTLTSTADNTGSAIQLGSNTFNFYGTSYTSTQINANPNGLITFVSASTASANGDLTASPTQRSLAVLWDDWTAAVDVPGATNSALLYKLEDTTGDAVPDRLIIEWSDIATTTTADGTMTFQAVLMLNTGATPGQIYFNYPDLEMANPSRTRGASASVGLKDTNIQGANRLLVSLNSAVNPWVQSNKAVVFGLDVDPPDVLSASFNFVTTQEFVVQFSEDVSASLNSADLVLTNTTLSNTIIDPASYSVIWDGATNTARFHADVMLPDGNYTAQLINTGIRDGSLNRLDGDSDLVAGGDYSAGFYVLAGDANRDRKVDVGDLGILASNWQQSPRTFEQGDFDYSGTVDVNDLGILATKWQSDLLGPAAFAGLTATSGFSRSAAKNRIATELFSQV